MTSSLYQVTQGATVNAPDVNQLIQAFQGTYLVNGPFVQIATQQITVATSGFSFFNIPQYNNLLLVWAANSDDITGQSTDMNLVINADGGAFYSYEQIQAIGTGLTAASVNNDINGVFTWIPTNGAGGTGTQGSGALWLPNWSQFNSAQNYVAQGMYYNTLAASNAVMKTYVGVYAPTTRVARTQLSIGTGLGNFIPSNGANSASSFTLYGSM